MEKSTSSAGYDEQVILSSCIIGVAVEMVEMAAEERCNMVASKSRVHDRESRGVDMAEGFSLDRQTNTTS